MKRVSMMIGAAAAVALAVTAAGCTKKAGDAAGHKQVTIKFPTATASGALYAVGAAITNLWDTQIDYVSASSQASNGGIDNLNQIADGESQVSIAISSNCFQSYNGTDSFDGRANKKLRVIAGLYFNPNQVVVTQKSGIASLTDVKGKHFAVAAAGSSVEGECNNHFTAAGLSYPADIRAEYIAFGDAADMLQNGTIDGAWIMSGTPAAAVSQACSAGCKLLNIGSETIETLKKSYPWYAAYTIPAGTYPGQTEDVQTSAIKMTMFCSADLDEETVYTLTKTFWEHIDELGEAQKNLKGLSVEDAVKDIAGLPLHAGAERYYKEIGIL
ncbi:MAG: TAXI family TRAP transporter solute-binding subunit [Treponema sp.]|nr:TAXI family TRAP transporter solute-binding subunit [Treponema sp.]